MSEYAVLYLEINIFSLVLIAIILHRTTGMSKMVAQRNFAMSIIAEMVFFASDTIFVLINSGVLRFGRFDRAAMFICKEVYFFATSVMCFFWFIYFEHLRDTSLIKEKKMVRRASSILWVMSILLIVNIFTGILFYVDPDGIYRRGPFFILTYIFSYTYVLVACIRTLKSIRDSSYDGERNTLVILALFLLAPGAAGIIQFVFPRLPVACGVLAITTLILYLNWIDQLISLDPLTGLNNRKQLSYYYETWVRNHDAGGTISIMMIDANKFKSINDTYGHIRGDTALKNIAQALRQGSRVLPVRTDIARYGGDEFAVLFESENADDGQLMKNAIIEALQDINKRTEIPFDVTVSIGLASSDGRMSLKELIEKADEAMYEEKRQGSAFN